MGYRTYIVIKEQSTLNLYSDGQAKHEEVTKEETPKKEGLYSRVMRHKAKEVVEDLKKDIKEYIDAHGYHFTDALAEFASRQMVNVNGQKHSWTVDKVKSYMTTYELELPEGATYGDITYAANMGYADFYNKDILRDDLACLKFALAMASDPDGYEGMIFKRWCTDMVEKHLKIDWMKFL